MRTVCVCVCVCGYCRNAGRPPQKIYVYTFIVAPSPTHIAAVYEIGGSFGSNRISAKISKS